MTSSPRAALVAILAALFLVLLASPLAANADPGSQWRAEHDPVWVQHDALLDPGIFNYADIRHLGRGGTTYRRDDVVGARRVVTGSDGSLYYTNTHYGDTGRYELFTITSP